MKIGAPKNQNHFFVRCQTCLDSHYFHSSSIIELLLKAPFQIRSYYPLEHRIGKLKSVLKVGHFFMDMTFLDSSKHTSIPAAN